MKDFEKGASDGTTVPVGGRVLELGDKGDPFHIQVGTHKRRESVSRGWVCGGSLGRRPLPTRPVDPTRGPWGPHFASCHSLLLRRGSGSEIKYDPGLSGVFAEVTSGLPAGGGGGGCETRARTSRFWIFGPSERLVFLGAEGLPGSGAGPSRRASLGDEEVDTSRARRTASRGPTGKPTPTPVSSPSGSEGEQKAPADSRVKLCASPLPSGSRERGSFKDPSTAARGPVRSHRTQDTSVPHTAGHLL